MSGAKRWFWVGARAEVRDRLAEALGGPPAATPVSEAEAGDVVVVDPTAGSAQAALPFGHAYSGVRALKERRGVAVYVVVDEADRVGVQLARFCLADGVLTWSAAQQQLAIDELGHASAGLRRPSVDDLLARLSREAGESGQENCIDRLLRFEREDTLLHELQDPETGLFDGPYATLKLDEEWKRAHRFHLPLSLLLLDLGLDPATSDADRRAALAEAAGVFLNECRDIDVLARFSENVFLLLLPGTGSEGARVLADRIVAALRARLDASPASRPAAGLATVPASGIRDRKSFLAVAEACLQRAQAAGAGGVETSWQ